MADPTNNQMNDLLGLKQNALTQMGTSGTSGFMGGRQKRPAPVDRFPALEKKEVIPNMPGTAVTQFDVTTEPLDIAPFVPSFGVEIKTDVKPLVTKPSMITPVLSLDRVMNFQDPEAVATINNAQGFVSETGKIVPFKTDEDFDTRVEKANREAAVRIINSDDSEDREYRIPWEKEILRMEKLPDPNQVLTWSEDTGEVSYDGGKPVPITELRRVLAKDMTEADLVNYRNVAMLGSLNMVEKEVGNALYARFINNRLIEAGVEEARTRADLINYAISSPLMGDLEKTVAAVGENVIKFPIEMVLWGVGESIDIVDNLILDLDQTKDFGWFDIRQSSRRGAIMDTFWEPYTHRLIATMAQRGTKISLPVAEEYASLMTGFVPRLTKLYAEIAIPSKIATKISTVLSKKEMNLFRQFHSEKVAKDPSLSFDDTFELFKQQRAKINPAEGEPTWMQKIKAKVVGDRVTKGLQLDDAALEVGDRVEVISAVRYKDSLVRQRDALNQGIKKRGGVANPSDLVKLGELNRSINNSIVSLQAAQKSSASAKFIRDAKEADVYMTLGSGTIGHYFQQTDENTGFTGNQQMGELVGLFTGIALYLARGSAPAAYQMYMTNRFTARLSSKKAQLEFLTKNISHLSPELQTGIIERAKYLDELHNVLIAEGVDPKLVAQGIAGMSNLGTLKALEDITRSQLTVKEIKNFSVAHLEQNLQLQDDLVNNLREILENIDGAGSATPKGDFYRMINMAVKVGQESVDDLGKSIDTINKNGVQYYLDLIDGNTEAFGKQLGTDTVANFEKAMENLMQKYEIVDSSKLTTLEFNKITNEALGVVVRQIQKHADTVRSRLGTTAGARAEVEAALGPGGVIAAGQRTQASIPNFDSTGDLMAAVLEAKHAVDKAIAKKPYQQLDDAGRKGNFVDAQGNPISGQVVVRVDDIFESLFSREVGGETMSRPNLPVGKMSKSDMSPADISTLEATFDQISEPFFLMLAEGTNKTVDEVVADLVKTFEAKGKTFRKGSKQAQVVQYMRQEAAKADSDLQIFEMSFSDLRELDKALRHVEFGARKGNNIERATLYQNLQKQVESKFNQFELISPDGSRTSVDSLGVVIKGEGGDEIIEVSEALRRANAGWSEFKTRWYDTQENARVPAWMSWGNRGIVDVSVNNPLGIRYKNATREWIDIKKIANDPLKEGGRIMDSLNLALGKKTVDRSTGVPSYTFVEGDPMTQAVASTLKASVADYILSLGAKLNEAELSQQLDNIDSVFVMIGADGTKKSMINAGEVFDDVKGFSPVSIGAEAHKRATQRVVSDIRTEIDKALEPAKKLKKQKELAVKILESYGPGRVNMDQVADTIVGGGIEQINAIKRDLKTAGGFTDQEVSTILAEVYIDGLEKKSIRYTQNVRVTSAKGTIVPETYFDNATMFEMLGLNDPNEKGAVVRELIGERRYAVWNATAKLMAARDDALQKRSLDVTGIPRSFSVESYISRFYAINRGVVSLRYVGTEAVLQQMRNTNYNFIRSVLSDPEVGEMFIEMVKTGKPLTPTREASFYRGLVSSYAQYNNLFKEKPQTMEDTYGRAFTLYPDFETGIPITAEDAVVGGGKRIPIFPEIEKRKAPAMTTPSLFR